MLEYLTIMIFSALPTLLTLLSIMKNTFKLKKYLHAPYNRVT